MKIKQRGKKQRGNNRQIGGGNPRKKRAGEGRKYGGKREGWECFLGKKNTQNAY